MTIKKSNAVTDCDYCGRITTCQVLEGTTKTGVVFEACCSTCGPEDMASALEESGYKVEEVAQ